MARRDKQDRKSQAYTRQPQPKRYDTQVFRPQPKRSVFDDMADRLLNGLTQAFDFFTSFAASSTVGQKAATQAAQQQTYGNPAFRALRGPRPAPVKQQEPAPFTPSPIRAELERQLRLQQAPQHDAPKPTKQLQNSPWRRPTPRP